MTNRQKKKSAEDEVGLTACFRCGKKAQVFMYPHSFCQPYRCFKCQLEYEKRNLKEVKRELYANMQKKLSDKISRGLFERDCGFLICADRFGLINREQATKLYDIELSRIKQKVFRKKDGKHG